MRITLYVHTNHTWQCASFILWHCVYHTTYESHATNRKNTTHESHNKYESHRAVFVFISLPSISLPLSFFGLAMPSDICLPLVIASLACSEACACIVLVIGAIASAMQPSLLRGRGAMICSKDGYLYLSVHVIVIEGVKPTCMEGIFDEDEVPESSDVIALHLRLAGRRRCEAQGAKLVERRTPSLLRGYAWRKIYCGAMNRMRDVLLKGARPVSRPEPRRQRAALGEKLHGKLGPSGDRSSDCKPE